MPTPSSRGSGRCGPGHPPDIAALLARAQPPRGAAGYGGGVGPALRAQKRERGRRACSGGAPQPVRIKASGVSMGRGSARPDNAQQAVASVCCPVAGGSVLCRLAWATPATQFASAAASLPPTAAH